MRLKILPRRTPRFILLVVLLLLPFSIFYFTPKSSNQPAQVAAPTNITPVQLEKAAVESPLRLRIPAINVNATFEYVGLTLKEELVAPKNPANAGWYVRGPRPGEQGSAVIDGHSGYRNNVPAIFDNLHRLLPGDNVYVEDEKGVTTVFVVRASQSYDPKTDASSVFTSTDGKAHLNLITCEGTWNEVLKSYSSRLVVFTVKQ